MPRSAPTLLRLVASRIFLFALIAMLLEIGIVFSQYRRDTRQLGFSLIAHEAGVLQRGLVSHDGHLSFRLPEGPSERYEAEAPHSETLSPGYYLRVRTAGGQVLYSSCDSGCTQNFLPLDLNPPDLWLREIEPGSPLTIAGGQTVVADGQRVLIELAIIKDPDGEVEDVLGIELFDHMLVPMSLMLTLVMGATVLSVRRALAPVAAAARAANSIDPRVASSRLATAGMPREIAGLTTAVNRAFTRVGELITAQRLFTAAISHEIRTPVAIARLELAHIDHPRARKAEGDLDALTHVLEQLTALARLDAVDRSHFSPVPLSQVLEDIVASIAPLVFERGKTIQFEDRDGGTVAAIPALLETLVRNLIENALRHTPGGTAIRVEAGPGPRLAVSDDGPGLPPHAAWPGAEASVEAGALKLAGGLGVGLRLVRRIADMHGAQLVIRDHCAATGVRGTEFDITFPR